MAGGIMTRRSGAVGGGWGKGAGTARWRWRKQRRFVFRGEGMMGRWVGRGSGWGRQRGVEGGTATGERRGGPTPPAAVMETTLAAANPRGGGGDRWAASRARSKEQSPARSVRRSCSFFKRARPWTGPVPRAASLSVRSSTPFLCLIGGQIWVHIHIRIRAPPKDRPVTLPAAAGLARRRTTQKPGRAPTAG